MNMWPNASELADHDRAEAVLAACSFPELPGRFRQALEGAVRFLAERIPDLRGVVATGSVVRGGGHSTSDLDIYVLRWRPESQRVQRWFAGVPAELFINDADTLVSHRYRTAGLLEDALDVQQEDPATCASLLGRAVEGAVRCVFWAHGLWQPRDKELVRRLAELDADLAADVAGFFLAADLAEKASRARRIVRAAAGAEGFFEWESEVR